jgi:histidinol-phosphate aminotransferase
MAAMGERLPAGYHSPQLDVEVRLNTNESPWPPPSELQAVLAEAMGRIPLNRYPDRSAMELRAAVGERHGVGPEQVLCTNGSNEAIQLLLATVPSEQPVLVAAPTYALHTHLARLAGLSVVEVARDSEFVVDPEEFGRTARGAGLVFVCRPNNPTGTVDPIDVVRAAAVGHGLAVVDEAYAEFAGIEAAASPEGAAVVRTFSKAWAMAALRLGYVVAAEGLIAELAERALPYHLDSAKQLAGLAALRHREAMEERVAGIVAEREQLHMALATLPLDVWPSAANFILFRPRGRGAKEVWQLLVEKSVLVRDLSGLPGLENCLRVTIGTPEENRRFLGALSAIIG